MKAFQQYETCSINSSEDIKQTLRRRRNNTKITYRNVVFPGNQRRDSTLGHQGGGVHRLLI